MAETRREFLARTEGLFVGGLDNSDLRKFERLVEEGRAFRSYEGVGGFMGLATVRRAPASPEPRPEEGNP